MPFDTEKGDFLVMEVGDGEIPSNASDGAGYENFKEEETFGIMAETPFII